MFSKIKVGIESGQKKISSKIKVGIIGGCGYVGSALTELLLKHKYAEIKIITSMENAGKKVNEVFPELECDLIFSGVSFEALNKMDVVYLAVPHGSAKPIAEKLKCRVIDLSKDHRLTNTYGLPEIFKEEINGADFIANPGCYATACILASYPIKNLIKEVIFNGISGYSGAGKNAGIDYGENVIAYKLTKHNHVKEMEKVLGFDFSFTPHVVNSFSGLMCTAHILLKKPVKPEEIKRKYEKVYAGSFTKVVEHIPCTKEVTNTPYCFLGGFEFDGNNKLVIVSVIDNLLKGAASQAIENMNLMFNVNQKEGLNKFIG